MAIFNLSGPFLRLLLPCIMYKIWVLWLILIYRNPFWKNVFWKRIKGALPTSVDLYNHIDLPGKCLLFVWYRHKKIEFFFFAVWTISFKLYKVQICLYERHLWLVIPWEQHISGVKFEFLFIIDFKTSLTSLQVLNHLFCEVTTSYK